MLDKSMPYYNLILQRPKGLALPEPVVLPEGFRIVDYPSVAGSLATSASTDLEVEVFHKAWVDILVSVLEFDNHQEAQAYLETHYLIYPEELAKRLFFIASPEGELVATLTNWWHQEPVYEPSMHWVAVKPSHQGLGLGRAIIAEGVRRMQALEGDCAVYLHTQNWSVAAIGLYMDFGYIIAPQAVFAQYTNDFTECIKTLRHKIRTVGAPSHLSRAALLAEASLNTERLLLTPFGPEHVLAALKTLNTPSVRAYLGGPKSPEAATDAFVRAALGRGATTGQHIAVTLKEGTLIGHMMLDGHHEHSALELSYVFAESAWGHGYALEALSVFLEHCRHMYGLEALVAETQRANQKSCQLLERLGFKAIQQLERFGETQVIYQLPLNDYVTYLRKGFGQGPLNLTGVVVILYNQAGQVLLQKRGGGNNLWGLLGGICELGESFEAAAVREVAEESGLVLAQEALTLLGTNSGPQSYMHLSNGHQAYFMTVIYSAPYPGGTLVADGIESLKLQFFDLESLPERVPSTHRRMLEKFATERERHAL